MILQLEWRLVNQVIPEILYLCLFFSEFSVNPYLWICNWDRYTQKWQSPYIGPVSCDVRTIMIRK
jgi:hypothetical protein